MKVAIITPYYKEPREMIERCIRSVAAQDVPVTHLLVTFLVALGTNLSALWILIANGWMQNPVGAAFNPDTMRMEVTDFKAVIFNPVAQAKFVHTVSAGYTIAAVFVLGVDPIATSAPLVTS